MRLANTTMRYQVSAIRAKPVRPGLRSPPPSIAPNAFPFSSQMPSSLVPGIAQSVSGTPAQPLPSNPLTSSPSAFTLWILSATALSLHSLAASSTSSMFGRWTLPNKHGRALSNSSPVPSPACPMAKVTSCPYGPYATTKLFLFSRLCDRVRRRPHCCGILRPLASHPREKVRVQMSSPNDRRRRPRLASQRARFPPYL